MRTHASPPRAVEVLVRMLTHELNFDRHDAIGNGGQSGNFYLLTRSYSIVQQLTLALTVLMEENDGMTSGSASGATSKKSSKKSSKHHHGHHNLTPSKGKARGHHHVSLPPSIAERPKVSLKHPLQLFSDQIIPLLSFCF